MVEARAEAFGHSTLWPGLGLPVSSTLPWLWPVCSCPAQALTSLIIISTAKTNTPLDSPEAQKDASLAW